VLQVAGVSKRFGNVQALDAVSLTVRPGEIIGFLGPNGSGKTTSMRAIMGLISIDSGDITWDGHPIDASSRRRFGYMPAERGMYPKMKIGEQLTYFARLAGMPTSAAKSAAEFWIEQVGLDGRADTELQSLSTGNQQRVQLAISLIHEPDLLILDEPFSGLDPTAVETMKGILAAQVERGAAVLFSSHQLDLVSDVSEHVTIIDRGRVVLDGGVNALRERSPYRYAAVLFAEPTNWSPTVADAEVVELTDRSVKLRLNDSHEASTVLADAERAGRVVGFSFAPPNLSEVFLAVVGDPHRAASSVETQRGVAS
jgi:ABC-2 type transport system ATP-binding protein